MALMLAKTYAAFKAAGVSDAEAEAAAEEVASYENRLTQLTTLVRVAIGILVILLGSQAGLWMEVGKLNSTVTQISAKIDLLSRK